MLAVETRDGVKSLLTNSTVFMSLIVRLLAPLNDVPPGLEPEVVEQAQVTKQYSVYVTYVGSENKRRCQRLAVKR